MIVVDGVDDATHCCCGAHGCCWCCCCRRRWSADSRHRCRKGIVMICFNCLFVCCLRAANSGVTDLSCEYVIVINIHIDATIEVDNDEISPIYPLVFFHRNKLKNWQRQAPPKTTRVGLNQARAIMPHPLVQQQQQQQQALQHPQKMAKCSHRRNVAARVRRSRRS